MRDDCIRPGKPVDYAHGASFNGRIRDDLVCQQCSRSVGHAQDLSEDWQADDNTVRPHTALGGLAPATFLAEQAGPHGARPARSLTSDTQLQPAVATPCGGARGTREAKELVAQRLGLPQIGPSPQVGPSEPAERHARPPDVEAHVAEELMRVAQSLIALEREYASRLAEADASGPFRLVDASLALDAEASGAVVLTYGPDHGARYLVCDASEATPILRLREIATSIAWSDTWTSNTTEELANLYGPGHYRVEPQEGGGAFAIFKDGQRIGGGRLHVPGTLANEWR